MSGSNNLVAAARRFAEAVERCAVAGETVSALDPYMATWYALNAARVELLLTLAEHAGEEWEPGPALHLLRAADTANGNVERVLEPPGPVKRALRERLERVAVQMIENFRTKETYADCVGVTLADFQEICRGIESCRGLEQLEAWESEMGGAS